MTIRIPRHILLYAHIKLECERPNCQGQTFSGLLRDRRRLQVEAYEWAQTHNVRINSHVPLAFQPEWGVPIFPHRVVKRTLSYSASCRWCGRNWHSDRFDAFADVEDWAERHEVSKRHQEQAYDRDWVSAVADALGLPR